MVKRKNNILGLVPARFGSKGIKQKNIRKLWGKPLVAYPIQNGLDSKYISRTICTTDSKKIAEIAQSYGAEVPFIRPRKFSDDYSNDLGFVKHALDWLEENEGWSAQIVVILRPTAPTRSVSDIDKAIEILLANSDAHSIKSIIPVSQNPYKMWKHSDSKFILPILTSDIFEQHNSARQLLPEVYWQNGYIDIVRADIVRRDNSVHGFKILPYLMCSDAKVDLDTVDDWNHLEGRGSTI